MARSCVLPLLLVLAPVLHAAGPENASTAPVSETLPNGLRVTILADPTQPVVATQLWYHVGSADEDRGSRGLAHLFEHLMFGGTRRFGKRAYWDHHHRHGGYDNAFTSEDETVYVSEIVPEAHREVLVMEADRMEGLVLDTENLENEQRIVTEELRLSTENDPLSRLFVRGRLALLGDHPYAHTPAGTKEDIAQATLDSCRRFYGAWYRPGNAHLVIVGPVDPAATLAEVRAAFGSAAPGGATRQAIPPLDTWTFPEELRLREDLPPVETAVLAFPLPPADSEDAVALEVLYEIIGGGQLDLFREELVRKRRKALEAGLERLAVRRGGMLFFYAANLPYRRERTAFRHMEEALLSFSDMGWLTEERLQGVKRRLKRQELEKAYHASSIAFDIGWARWWLGDERRAFDRAERIEAVGRDEVVAAFRRYVEGRRPIRLYVRPERVPVLVRLFGWLYPLVR